MSNQTYRDSEYLDGLSGEELFNLQIGLTYRDFLVLPGFIDFHPSEVELETRLTRNIKLKRPFISSPMDTVTESQMAIAQALMGGIGIIHYNNTIEEQVALVEKVKRFENGFITDPVILGPKNVIRDLDAIKERKGFTGIPVTEDGTRNSKLIGIVTNRDIDFEKNREITLDKVMTTNLITGKEGITLQDANEIIKKSKIGKLPIVDSQGKLVSLVSRSDLKKIKNSQMPPKTKEKGFVVELQFLLCWNLEIEWLRCMKRE
ncbi:CBS domain protein [Leptospira interrogans serovar Zanoni str. LT2156]|uniref:CBS domain protein n=1 Tax=Leptospira interrogans serovar Zanoni str. LT2156 TaxID=1001601 RepID=M6HCC9_LEPIR|nr:CBS domain protein [Leptospira interrogans serovar Zanoni str. LT2156]